MRMKQVREVGEGGELVVSCFRGEEEDFELYVVYDGDPV